MINLLCKIFSCLKTKIAHRPWDPGAWLTKSGPGCAQPRPCPPCAVTREGREGPQGLGTGNCLFRCTQWDSVQQEEVVRGTGTHLTERWQSTCAPKTDRTSVSWWVVVQAGSSLGRSRVTRVASPEAGPRHLYCRRVPQGVFVQNKRTVLSGNRNTSHRPETFMSVRQDVKLSKTL